MATGLVSRLQATVATSSEGTIEHLAGAGQVFCALYLQHLEGLKVREEWLLGSVLDSVQQECEA